MESNPRFQAKNERASKIMNNIELFTELKNRDPDLDMSFSKVTLKQVTKPVRKAIQSVSLAVNDVEGAKANINNSIQNR